MDLTAFRDYTRRLLEIVGARDDVLGLVALGSMAELGQTPDDHSDHDLFLITSVAAAERYRDRLDWLPDADRIALAFRETAHGFKAIYRDGHLVEGAVFTLDELALARVNRYRVLLDRADVTGRMRHVADETARRLRDEAPGDAWLVGQLLAEALVAALRAARGEHLSAAQRVQSATVHLLRLVARHVPTDAPECLDDLDPLRRVERAYPAIAARLRAAARTSELAHVAALLDVAGRELAPLVPAAALAAVARRVAELRPAEASA